MLTNKKVYVKDKSEAIQKKAFELWWGWSSWKDKTIQALKESFLFFYEKDIWFTSDNFHFQNHAFKEVTPEEILAMEVPNKERKVFKPFDTVIVIWNWKEWVTAHYSYYNSKHEKHVCWMYWFNDDSILPYEGNEHLVGTTNNP